MLQGQWALCLPQWKPNNKDAWLQYAGNVVVYGPASPCDGDWYGGVTAEKAEAFLDALTNADVGGHGGVSEAALRPLWRGRMGLSKEEQLQVYHLLQASICCASDAGASWTGTIFISLLENHRCWQPLKTAEVSLWRYVGD